MSFSCVPQGSHYNPGNTQERVWWVPSTTWMCREGRFNMAVAVGRGSLYGSWFCTSGVRAGAYTRPSQAVDELVFKELLPPEQFAKYRRYLLRSFVEENLHVRWCPSPSCNKAVLCKDAKRCAVLRRLHRNSQRTDVCANAGLPEPCHTLGLK